MKHVGLLLALLFVVSLPVQAARLTAVPIVHPTVQLTQAYVGTSVGNLSQTGYLTVGTPTITSAPGILSIVPGTNWSNFVAAGVLPIPIAYTIKNVVLQKTTPTVVQCGTIFLPKTISQQGTPNIRLWWPLMYEVPSTTFTLTILYGTSVLFDDDGPLGPNPPAYVHTEVWSWHVDATITSMQNELELFHQLPFGLDEVPLVSDEVLYPALQAKLTAIAVALALPIPDLATAGLLLGDFEMEVMDACILTSPLSPKPTGSGTGIANSLENPACCKLLADAEYVGRVTGVFQSSR